MKYRFEVSDTKPKHPILYMDDEPFDIDWNFNSFIGTLCWVKRNDNVYVYKDAPWVDKAVECGWIERGDRREVYATKELKSLQGEITKAWKALDNKADITFCMQEVVKQVPCIVIDDAKFEVGGNFVELITDLCEADGYFGVRFVSDIPWVAYMIDMGWVNHSNRGCSATEYLKKHKGNLIKQFEKCYYN